VFSNNQNTCISKSDTVVVPSDSYHPALDLMYTFDYELPPIDNSHKFFDFRRGCYMQICSFLSSYNWLLTITSLDIDSATLALYDALHFCVLNFVPEVEYKPSKFPSWFSRDLKSIVLEKKGSMHSINQLIVLVTTLTFLLFGRNTRLSTKNVIVHFCPALKIS
jgi:hypothetical protein